MYLKLWNPDVTLKSRVWFMHTFISFTTVQRRRPEARALEKPTGATLPRTHPGRERHRLLCQGSLCKCFDQSAKPTVLSSCRLLLLNILSGEALNNCLHSEEESQEYLCWTNKAGRTVSTLARSILIKISPGTSIQNHLWGGSAQMLARSQTGQDWGTQQVGEMGHTCWDLPRPLWGRVRLPRGRF